MPGLVAEGRTDESFLRNVIVRQLRALTKNEGRHPVEIVPVQTGDCASILDETRVLASVRELAGDCHLIFVHNDYRERRKAERVVALISEESRGYRAVPVIPIRETESWLLADRSMWSRLKGAGVSYLPQAGRDVEKIPDPKVVLDEVRPDHLSDMRELFAYAGRMIGLDELQRLPAYRTWLAATKSALKELRYI